MAELGSIQIQIKFVMITTDLSINYLYWVQKGPRFRKCIVAPGNIGIKGKQIMNPWAYLGSAQLLLLLLLLLLLEQEARQGQGMGGKEAQILSLEWNGVGLMCHTDEFKFVSVGQPQKLFRIEKVTIFCFRKILLRPQWKAEPG